MSSNYSDLYPHLFNEVIWPWGPTRAHFVLLDTPPPDSQIANVNIVPHTVNRWVILKLHNGNWEIPGGTLEAGETYVDAIQRELLEEVGASLLSMQLVGAWDCLSLADQPYRSHLPHPRYFRLLVCAEITIQHPPANPPGAEQVALVEALPLEEVIRRFESQDRQDLAQAYQLASSLLLS